MPRTSPHLEQTVDVLSNGAAAGGRAHTDGAIECDRLNDVVFVWSRSVNLFSIFS